MFGDTSGIKKVLVNADTVIKKVWVDTTLIFSANSAVVGDSIVVNGNHTAYLHEEPYVVNMNTYSVNGSTLSISNGQIYNNGTGPVTLIISGTTNVGTSPGDGGGMIWAYINYTDQNGVVQTIDAGYGKNNLSLTKELKSLEITIAANSYIYFSIKREYDPYSQTVEFKNYSFTVKAAL